MFLDLIGKLIYPHLPSWQRRRNVKILIGMAVVGIVLAASIVFMMWVINNHYYG